MLDLYTPPYNVAIIINIDLPSKSIKGEKLLVKEAKLFFFHEFFNKIKLYPKVNIKDMIKRINKIKGVEEHNNISIK